MAKTVLIVGSGIIGASVAWHLARAGCRVTVLDRGPAGGLATPNSWGWINASWGNPEAYFRLRVRSMQEWRRMAAETPGLAVDWCGGLLWDLPPDELEAYAAEHEAWGYGIRRVGRDEALALEPNLKQPPDFALHVAQEGVAEPLAAARAMLADAEAHGATVLADRPVSALVEKDCRIAGVQTEDGELLADETVLAAGAGAASLLETAGITLRLDTPAGLLAHSRPTGPLLNGLVMSPGVHVRQTAEGRLVAGADFAGSDPSDRAPEMAGELLAEIRAMVKGAEELELEFHTVGYRPTPAGGFPAIGRPRETPGLYAAVTHSGVTLAPAIGHFAAKELLEGVRDFLLAPYHPDRAALV